MKRKVLAMMLLTMLTAGVMGTNIYAAEKGWIRSENGWSYTADSGIQMTSRWARINGKWYWFDADGRMAEKEWKRLSDGKWYYFTDSGAAAQETWVKTDGKWYYLEENGAWDRSAVPYTLKADGKAVDLSAQPYMEGKTMMIPAEAAAKAIGLETETDGKTLTLSDGVQRVSVSEGEGTVSFQGLLTIIDLSREVSLSEKASFQNGVLYLPLSFFEEFFAEVSVSEKEIRIDRLIYALDS